MKTAETAALDASLVEPLCEVLQEHPVRLAILFGSHATGTAHSASDIDLAVELDSLRSSDAGYNEAFFGVSADLSAALETNDVDLVDLHSTTPALATSIFEHGVLLMGDQEHAAALREELTPPGDTSPSPRERLDAALARIDTHLEDGDRGVPAAGETEDDFRT